MWKLARDSGSLDANSPYAYLLFAQHFSDTCLIAESEGGPVGFVLGFRPPNKPGTLFVWQIGVAQAHRGNGIGREMLTALLRDLSDPLHHDGIRYLEATVTPSNTASQRMFRSLADSLETAFEERIDPVFPTDMFPDLEGGHEAEWGIRIGPIQMSTMRQEAHSSTATA